MYLARYRQKDNTVSEARIALWNPVAQHWLDAGPCPGSLLFSPEYLSSLQPSNTPLLAESIDFLPPVPSVEKILCTGLNYADHAEEFHDPIPSEPVLFCKSSNTLNAHLQPIQIPTVSDKIDYEAELVVVIGKEGKQIPKERAMEYVFGFTAGNDVSCRDWQSGKPAKQWFLGKSFDTFAPVGPAIVTRDSLPNPNQLSIRSVLNGTVMQSSNTSYLIFSIETLIAYISQVITLKPGDLLFTGTPGGVGVQRNPPVFLKDGDTIQIEIEGLLPLTNTVQGLR